MKKLNNKGFTLVEMLAVVIILGVLTAITVPTVTTLIAKNQQDNLENLEKTIISAAKMYISDNRYEIKLNPDTTCGETRNILKINETSLTDSKLTIKTLIANGYIEGSIRHPKTKESMDINTSYIKVTYDCTTKDYKYDTPYMTGTEKWN